MSIGVAGVAVHLLLDLDWRTSFLWGAVLSSTDAAAVFSVLRGVGVRRRLAAALELESGLNDAPVVITVVLLAGDTTLSWTDPLLVVAELAIGAAVGVALGFAGAWGLRRGALPAAGLYPLATVAVIAGAYSLGQLAHGSGFLATYVAALILGNSRLPHRASTLSFAEGLGWLAQIGLFVLLGLYVDPTRLPAALVPGIVVGLVVLLVARPLSVIAAATPFRVPWREQAFLSWSGLRGAVPIVLAMIPLMLGRDGAVELVDTIVVVVVIYTLMQGTTLPWVARKLGVIEGGQATEIQLEAAPLDEMDAHVLQVTIPPESKMHGVYLSQLRLPKGAVIALIVRGGSPIDVVPCAAAGTRRPTAGGRSGKGAGRDGTPPAGGQSRRRPGVLVRRTWRTGPELTPEARRSWRAGSVGAERPVTSSRRLDRSSERPIHRGRGPSWGSDL